MPGRITDFSTPQAKVVRRTIIQAAQFRHSVSLRTGRATIAQHPASRPGLVRRRRAACRFLKLITNSTSCNYLTWQPLLDDVRDQ
jgi:hypothetical protein